MSYLVVKQSGSNKSLELKTSTPTKPYIAVKISGSEGYLPLTTETSGTGVKVKNGNSNYKIVESYTTTETKTTTTSKNSSGLEYTVSYRYTESNTSWLAESLSYSYTISYINAPKLTNARIIFRKEYTITGTYDYNLSSKSYSANNLQQNKNGISVPYVCMYTNNNTNIRALFGNTDATYINENNVSITVTGAVTTGKTTTASGSVSDYGGYTFYYGKTKSDGYLSIYTSGSILDTITITDTITVQ